MYTEEQQIDVVFGMSLSLSHVVVVVDFLLSIRLQDFSTIINKHEDDLNGNHMDG